MNTRRHILLPCVLLAGMTMHAQVEVDQRVELTGALPADRQVHGLADPTAPEDALNARSLQRGTTTYALATGGDTLLVLPDSAAAVPLTGTRVDLLCPSTNAGPVTLIFATDTAELVKGGTLPLASGDVHVGEVLGILFDGTRWHLLNTRRTSRRPCPGGFTQVNELYCIQPAQNALSEWTAAAAACASLDARLCTWGEWYNACVKATNLGLTGMIGDWEWTNNSANADTFVRVVGLSTCTQAATSAAWGGPLRSHRCCYKR